MKPVTMEWRISDTSSLPISTEVPIHQIISFFKKFWKFIWAPFFGLLFGPRGYFRTSFSVLYPDVSSSVPTSFFTVWPNGLTKKPKFRLDYSWPNFMTPKQNYINVSCVTGRMFYILVARKCDSWHFVRMSAQVYMTSWQSFFFVLEA